MFSCCICIDIGKFGMTVALTRSYEARHVFLLLLSRLNEHIRLLEHEKQRSVAGGIFCNCGESVEILVRRVFRELL